MKIRFSIYEPALSGSSICNSTLSKVNPSGLYIEITQGYKTVYSNANLGAGSDSVSNKVVMLTHEGREVNCDIDWDIATEIITITIGNGSQDYMNVWDEFDIGIRVGKLGYFTYTGQFTMFGYDIGNEGLASTDNPDFSIILVQNDYDPSPLNELILPYSSLVAWRRPFTDKVYIYKNNSSPGVVEYYNYDTGATLSTSTNDILHIEENSNINIYCITRYNNLSCTLLDFVSISKVQWMPDYNVVLDCNNVCPTECTTSILSENRIRSFIDFANVTTVKVNDSTQYPSKDLAIEAKVINSSGTVEYIEKDCHRIEYFVNNLLVDQTSYAGLIYNWQSNLFSFPEKGDFVIEVCVGLIGHISSSLSNVDVPVGHYQVLVTDCDFDNLLAGGSANNLNDIFYCVNPGTPNTWGTFGEGRLLPLITTGIPTADKYYMIRYYTGTADFTNLLQNPNLGRIFYYNGQSINWGTTHPIDPVVGIMTDAAIAEVYITHKCCKSITVSNCYWWETNRLSCSSYEVFNHSLSDVAIAVEQLQDDNTYTTVHTDTIPALDSLVINHSTDGVYRYSVVNSSGVTEYQIIIAHCNIESCFLQYLQEIMCECNKDDCREKDHYDFNSFAIALYTYMSLLHAEYGFHYIYTTFEVEDLQRHFELHNYYNKIMQYCEKCINSNCINNNNCK